MIRSARKTVGRLLSPEQKRRIRQPRQLYRIRREYGPEETPVASAWAILRMLLRPKKTVLFHPTPLGSYQVLYKMCVVNGYWISESTKGRYDIVHKNWDITRHDEVEWLSNLESPVVNIKSMDISKGRVQDMFGQVFGYDLAVDPLCYEGFAVRKSDANCRHDGMIVECPVDTAHEGDYVYQKLIDTDNGDGFCVDHRVPVIGGAIPLVYLKYRPVDNRFKTFTDAELVATEDVFSQEEQELIARLAAEMGLDYGEMDVLRDNHDGRLYVVDVNNTPSGPPRGLTSAERRRAVAVLAAAYRNLVELRPSVAEAATATRSSCSTRPASWPRAPTTS